MNFQFDDYARNEELLETMQSAIEDRSLDVPEEIHYEEYGSSGYTRLYVKREVGRLTTRWTTRNSKSGQSIGW